MNLCLRLAMSWVGRRVFTPPDPPVAVAWQSVTANGSDGTTTTTQITFTFDVDPGELSAANFTIDWATKGTMTGTGTTRVLPISDITADNNTSQTVTLASNPSGYTITPTSRSVTVYVQDIAVEWQSLTANGTPDEVTTTELTLEFDEDPGPLTTGSFILFNADITGISGTGAGRVLTINNVVDTALTLSVTSPTGYAISPDERSVTANIEEVAPNEITFISGEANGESDVTTSNSVTLTFSEDPAGLAASDITVTGATKGALSGSGTTRALAISSLSVDDSQTVNVAIADNNDNTFSPNNRDVTVYVEAVSNPPIASGTFAPPAGNVDSAYFYDASALFTGGTPTSYALATGSLPAGVSFNTSTGVFSGTPTTEETETGVSVSATNADGSDTTNTASVVIAAAVEPTGDFILARSANTTVAGSPDYDLQITASLTTAPNPAGIVFNALTSSTFTGVDDPEKELSFWWEFDDDGAVFDYVSSDLGRNNANKAQGGITGHVFTDVGTYTVKAYCYNHDTDEFGYDEITITVTDADTVYSGTDTVCLDPSGTFTGAPAGSQQVTTWSAAITAIDLLSAGGRFLIANGQEVQLGFSDPYISLYENMRYGSFGTGESPIIRLPSDEIDNFGNMFAYGNAASSRGDGNNTVFYDWQIIGNYDPESGVGENNDSSIFRLDSPNGVSFHNLSVSGIRHVFLINETAGVPTNLLVSNCNLADWFDYGLLGRSANSAIVGNSIKQKATSKSGENAKDKFFGKITSNGTQTVYTLENLQIHGDKEKYLRVFDYDPSARTYDRLLETTDFTFTEGTDDTGTNTGNATHELELNTPIASGHELYYHSAYYPWHGPMRLASAIGVAISQNEFRSRAGWSSNGLAHQPCVRWNSSGTINAQGFINQNKMEGGYEILQLTPQNDTTRQYPSKPTVVEANEFIGSESTDKTIKIAMTNVVVRNNSMIQPNVENTWVLPFKNFVGVEKFSATLTDVDADSIDIYNNTVVNLTTTANGAVNLIAVDENTDTFPIVNQGNNLLVHADTSPALPDYSPLDEEEYYRPEAGSAAIDGGTPNVLVWDDFAGELVGANASIGSFDQPAVPVVLNEIAFSGLTANGTTGTTTTDSLTLSFDEDPTGLAASDITVTGATKGALSGTGTTRSLAISTITVADSETVNVAIVNNNGNTFSPTNRDVTVYKEALNEIAFSALTANGASDTTTTDTLTLTFDEDPTDLAASDITVTGATKGALSGTGTSRTLAISSITVADSETVNVAIADNNGNTFSPTNRNVTVYKEVAAAQRLTFDGVDGYATFPNKTVGDGDTIKFKFNTTQSGVVTALIGDIDSTQPYVALINGTRVRVRNPQLHNFDIPFNAKDGEDHTFEYTHSVGGVPTLIFDGVEYDQNDATVGSGFIEPFNSVSLTNTANFMAMSPWDLEFTISGTTTKWNIDSGSTTTEVASVGSGDMTFENIVSGDWA